MATSEQIDNGYSGSVTNLLPFPGLLFDLPRFWRNLCLRCLKRGRNFIRIVICLICLTSLVFFARGDDPGGAEVFRAEFYSVLVESGEVSAVTRLAISAPRVRTRSLQITKLADEGTWISAGDFLIQFDDSGERAALLMAEEELLSSLADLEKSKAQQERALLDLTNSRKLAEYSKELANLRSESSVYESSTRQEVARLSSKLAELDLHRIEKQIESQIIINECQLARSQAKIKQKRTLIKAIHSRIDMFLIVAPQDGMVVYERVGSWNSSERLRVGYTAHPGEILLSIPNLDLMQMTVYLNEVDWPKVVLGQLVDIKLDAYPDSLFTGKVSSIAKLAQKMPGWRGESDRKGLETKIKITNSHSLLKPGMTAQASIVLEVVKDALIVPVGVLFEDEGHAVVREVNADDNLPVILGPRSDGLHVIEQGVTEGMWLSWYRHRPGTDYLGAAMEKMK